MFRRAPPGTDLAIHPSAISPIHAASFNRGKYSVPEDVLHADCCNGEARADWRVFAVEVGDLKHNFSDPTTGQTIRVDVRHVPEETCYAHTELALIDTADGSQVAAPHKVIKTQFRVRVSQRAQWVK